MILKALVWRLRLRLSMPKKRDFKCFTAWRDGKNNHSESESFDG